MNALLLELAPLALLLAVAWLWGTLGERRHLRRLSERERDYADVLLDDLARLPRTTATGLPPRLVTAEVVLAANALTTVLASIRRRFGGRIDGYRRLLERARREALVRLVEEARVAGYGAVGNVRVATVEVGGAGSGGFATRVAVMAIGTAYATATSPLEPGWLDVAGEPVGSSPP